MVPHPKPNSVLKIFQVEKIGDVLFSETIRIQTTEKKNTKKQKGTRSRVCFCPMKMTDVIKKSEVCSGVWRGVLERLKKSGNIFGRSIFMKQHSIIIYFHSSSTRFQKKKNLTKYNKTFYFWKIHQKLKKGLQHLKILVWDKTGFRRGDLW